MKYTLKTRVLSLGLSALLTVTLTACAGQPQPSPAPSQDTSIAASSEPTATAQGTLYIGLPGGQKEVPYSGENTPDALIAALATETGWDLTLAKPVAEGNWPNTLVVSLAKESGIYGAPPEQQKDDYHVFEVQDWVYSALNSISETLRKNLSLDGVQFTAADGGDLDFENGGVPFHIASSFFWDYDTVLISASPAPTDSIGRILLYPSKEDGAVMASADTLQIIYDQPGVKAGAGTVTVFHEDGSVFDTIDISNPTRTTFEPAAKELLDVSNVKAGTQISIYLSKLLEPGKKYNVSLDAGVLVRDGIQSEAIDKSGWEITCADYGTLSCSLPSGATKTSKVGQPVTYQITLGDRATAFRFEAEGCEISNAELTQDGTVTVTPQKTGESTWAMRYEVDGEWSEKGIEIVMVTE